MNDHEFKSDVVLGNCSVMVWLPVRGVEVRCNKPRSSVVHIPEDTGCRCNARDEGYDCMCFEGD